MVREGAGYSLQGEMVMNQKDNLEEHPLMLKLRNGDSWSQDAGIRKRPLIGLLYALLNNGFQVGDVDFEEGMITSIWKDGEYTGNVDVYYCPKKRLFCISNMYGGGQQTSNIKDAINIINALCMEFSGNGSAPAVEYAKAYGYEK